MARSEANFAKFAPVLEEWLALIKETSTLIDPSRPAYDVALEDFEKGMTSARIDEIFTQVRCWRKPKICTCGWTWRGRKRGLCGCQQQGLFLRCYASLTWPPSIPICMPQLLALALPEDWKMYIGLYCGISTALLLRSPSRLAALDTVALDSACEQS